MKQSTSTNQDANWWLIGPADQRHRLTPGTIILGRHKQVDLVIDDKSVSRNHARLEFDGQQCLVYDEGSANGSFINTQPIGPTGAPLNPGDRLRIGQTELLLEREEPVKPSPEFELISTNTLTIGAEVRQVAWSPDGRQLAIAGRGGVRLWDVTRQGMVGLLEAGQMDILEHSITWSPDSQMLISGGSGLFLNSDQSQPYGTVHWWQVAEQRLVRVVSDSTVSQVLSVAWSPGGSTLALTWGRAIYLWDGLTGQHRHQLPGHQKEVRQLIWGTDDKSLISVAGNGRLWEIDCQEESLLSTTGMKPIQAVGWSPDGQWLAFGCEDGTIYIQQFSSSAEPEISKVLQYGLTGHTEQVSSLVWSLDGTKLISGSQDGTIRVWQVTKQQTLFVAKHPASVNWVAWSSDGARVASASADGTVQLWQPSAE